MLALISFLVSAFFFLFLALGETISDWNMLGWGLFFFVLGHLLGGIGPDLDRGRFGRD